MFPKLATSFLHGAPRAAVFQTQTAQFRTVLQFNPSFPPSPLPPTTPYQPNSILAHQPGAGSSRSNDRSSDSRSHRFYEGYTGPGRAVTQANAFLTSYDGTTPSIEEIEEVDLIRISHPQSIQRSPKRRLKSPLGPLDEPFTVIKPRIRHRHGLASPPRPSPLTLARIAFHANRQSVPLQIPFPETRGESSLAHANAITGLPPPLLRRPKSPRPPRSPVQRVTSAGERDFGTEISIARQTNNYDNLLAIAEVLAHPITSHHHLLHHHQTLLDSLVSVYRPGDSIEPAVRLLQRLLDQDITPYVKVYSRIITLLCWRDRDVRGEGNFERALGVYDAALQKGVVMGRETINRLLSGCVVNKDPLAATRLLKDAKGNPVARQRANAVTYALLIRTHRVVGDFPSAQSAFEDMKHHLSSTTDIGLVTAWNEMISVHFASGNPELAIGLVEGMLTDPGGPHPNVDTYTTVIRGFVDGGDMAVACDWFDRLLSSKSKSVISSSTTMGDAVEALMEDVDSGSKMALTLPVSSLAPLPPSREAWNALLDGLCSMKDLPAYAKYYSYLPDSEGSRLALLDKLVALSQDALIRSKLDAEEVFKHLVAAVRPKRMVYNLHSQITPRLQNIVELMVERGRLSPGMDVVSKIVRSDIATSGSEYFDGSLAAPRLFSSLLPGVDRAITMGRQDSELGLSQLLRLCHLGTTCGVDALSPSVCKAVVDAVNREGPENVKIQLSWDSQGWKLLTDAFVRHGAELGELRTMLEEVFPLFEKQEDVEIIRGMVGEGSAVGSPVKSAPVSPSFSPQTPLSASPPSSWESGSPVLGRIDVKTTNVAEKVLENKNKVSLAAAQKTLLASVKRGSFPSVDSLTASLVHFARNGLLAEARELYSQSSPIFKLRNVDPVAGWVQIEDAMMHASALGEDISASNVHRQRILEQGGVPSANSYAALVMAGKSLTDEATVAMSLFDEARRLGVRPHTFFYNVVISALSRARRASEALTLMEGMKLEGVPVTAVTYSAVIGACTRSGEEESAKYLFNELLATRGQKLTVPVFNTMIQMYVQIKADRKSALHYFDLMRNHGVKPTGFTYKLMMDCWGTIEPIDLARMEETFDQMCADRSVTLDGTHFASLINAYGCVAKDLDKAIQTFQSIDARSARGKLRAVLPDHICWEALINVFVVHHRADLLRESVASMKASKIQMTPYVANLIIKGLSQTGDIAGARETFEALVDPPTGFAGHVRAAGGPVEASVPDVLPTYREPSTWEAMVRAELGAGEKQRADELLRRMRNRNYPRAVLDRVGRLIHPSDGVSTPLMS